MQVTDELVDKIAHLARLSFDEKEKPGIREDLQKMIGFVEKLSELDTRDVAPLIHMSREVNVFREDVREGGVSTAEALSNAPERKDDFFTVPKVIKK
jgi:aspartyl-tRNA(Asn)/glutamyl-tRNA(Gln) amidotransferase subunit C